MKKLACILLCFLILVAGCGKNETEEIDNPEAKEEKIQIGMSFDSFVIERWQRDRDVFVSRAKELGAEVNVQNANGDIEKQKEQIDYFIKKGVDVIVVVCIDSESLQSVVKKAKDEGIIIIAYDRFISDSDIDLYITFDNEMVGTLMATSIMEANPETQNVLMLGGSPLDSNVDVVEQGFKAVMNEAEVNILDSIHCDGWKAEIAGEYIFNNEEIVLETNAIMCGNDNLAGQVISALSERRLAGNIIVVGQDADLEACQRIVEGTQLMTVYKPVEKLAKTAAECAIALAEGKSLDEFEAGVYESEKYDIPYIGLVPVAVTRENIDEVIINSGFHLREDVYLYQTEDTGKNK